MIGPGWFLLIYLCTPISTGQLPDGKWLELTFCMSYNLQPIGPFETESECLDAGSKAVVETPAVGKLAMSCKFIWDVPKG